MIFVRMYQSNNKEEVGIEVAVIESANCGSACGCLADQKSRYPRLNEELCRRK